MVIRYTHVLAVALLGLACACTDTPKPEILPGSASDQEHRVTVAPSASEDAQARAMAVGDSLVQYIEGSFLQLAESRPKAQALFVAQPDKLPAVQELLQRYSATLERRPLSDKEKKHWKRPSSLLGSRPSLQATVQERRFSSMLVYQRPIQIRRRNCASCEEPSLLDFMATDLGQLRVFSARGRPEGYEEGAVRGVWVVYFPKHAL